MSNLHPCANKCSEFKDGGQCFYCLINETVNQGVYSMHRTEHRIDLIVQLRSKPVARSKRDKEQSQ